MNIQNACETLLVDGLKAMKISLDPRAIEQLIIYLMELNKWNKAYNLSAIRDPLAMVGRHLLDSLALLPMLRQANAENASLTMVDVGTGAGLPGLPLAICCPDIPVTLLDSNGKKTRFLFQVKTALALDNVTIEHCRAEQFYPADAFSIVVSRAFASIGDMISYTEHLCQPNGRFWAMKGIYPKDELSEVAKHYIVDNSYPLSIPKCDGERHLLVIARATNA